MKKLLIILALLVSLGVVGTSAILLTPEKILSTENKNELFGVGGVKQNIGGREVKYDYTDDNADETFIIRSDDNNYSGIGKFVINFSIENISGQNQSINIGIPLVENNSRKIDYIKRFVSNNTVFIPTSTVIIPATASTTEREVITPAHTVSTPVWEMLNFTKPNQYIVNNKKTTANAIAEDFYSDSLQDGEKKYYELVLDYGDIQVTQEEFFIEVFGNKGGYGLLDPTITTIDGFNSDTKSIGNLNGQDGWSGSTLYDVENSVYQEGDQAVQIVNDGSGGTINLSISAKNTGIIGWYFRDSSTNSSCDIRLLSGANVKASIALTETGGLVFKVDAVQTDSFGSHSANTWYKAEIEIDDANNQFRGRIDSGSWTSWRSATAFTDIDGVRFNCGDGPVPYATTYIDYLFYNDNLPAPALKKKPFIFIFE